MKNSPTEHYDNLIGHSRGGKVGHSSDHLFHIRGIIWAIIFCKLSITNILDSMMWRGLRVGGVAGALT